MSLDPHRSCGLAKVNRMGRAQPEEPAFNMDVCLLFLGCVVMNHTLSSCIPYCDQVSREGRMCGEVGFLYFCLEDESKRKMYTRRQ